MIEVKREDLRRARAICRQSKLLFGMRKDVVSEQTYLVPIGEKDGEPVAYVDGWPEALAASCEALVNGQ